MVKAAKLLLALLIVSLAFMKPSVRIGGFDEVATDLLFVPVAPAWGAAMLAGRLRFRWNSAYWAILAYLAALAVSVAASSAPLHSAVKLGTIVYLALLAVLADQLVESKADLRACLRAWCAASALIAAALAVALAAFLVDPTGPVAEATRFHFGTLPPGAYPRFALTFYNANMLCAYVTVCAGVLLVALRLRWIGRGAGGLLLAATLAASLFTLSPGLGGIILLLGLWLWTSWRSHRPGVARVGLLAGIGASLLFLAATVATPFLHSTAPFLIRLPGLTLAPSGRLMAWIEAARAFAAHPLFGRGIGVDAVRVAYRDPSGFLQTITDAHDSFLNIAAQAGILGVAGLLGLLVMVWRRLPPMRRPLAGEDAARLGLGLSFLVAFGYEGLAGSFEDARFLWVLLGLFLAACRVERGEAAAA
jgi:O-antigen ligase